MSTGSMVLDVFIGAYLVVTAVSFAVLPAMWLDRRRTRRAEAAAVAAETADHKRRRIQMRERLEHDLGAELVDEIEQWRRETTR